MASRLHLLQPTHQLKFIILILDDAYGVQNEDGTWSGLIGMIHTGQADISINDLTITMERAKVPNYSFYNFIFCPLALTRCHSDDLVIPTFISLK